MITLRGIADPVLLKGQLARVRPVYTWARRLRAYRRFRAGRPHDPDFGALAALHDDAGLFLDVGASIGQSALSFRIFNQDAPILSLEPLAVHEGDLAFAARVARPMQYRIAGAADRSGQMVIHVPAVGGLDLTAEASLSRSSAEETLRNTRRPPSELKIREERVEMLTIDELHVTPRSIKVDVEGGELEVICGAMATIEANRPVLMVERSPSTPAVTDVLSAFGYAPYFFNRRANIFEPLTEAADPLNVFFLAADHLAAAGVV